MYAHEDWLVILPFALDEGQMLQAVALLTEGDEAEMTVIRRHIYLFAHLNERLFLQSVGNHILDADQFQVPFPGKSDELRQTGHGAVFVHDLHEGSGRVETGHLTEVDGCLGVSAAAQDAVLLSIKRVNMAGAPEGLGSGGRIGKGLDGLGTVVGRDARRAAFEFVDGHGEGGTQHRGVVLHLMGQIQFLAALDGDGCAEYAAGMFQHEVHLLGGNLFGGDNQVAFIFAVFVIHDNHEFSFLEVFYGFLYSVQSEIFHFFIPYLYI